MAGNDLQNLFALSLNYELQCARRMLELPKQQTGERAIGDLSIDQNFLAEELRLDLAENRA